MVKFISAYDRAAQKEQASKCRTWDVDEDGNPNPSMTEQKHKKECDINHIIKQYDKKGLLTHVNNAVKNYGDFTEVNEYQESLNTVIKADEAFGAMPSDIRKRFNNNAGEFFEFATNPENEDEMVALGLAVREVPAGPVEVIVTNTGETAPAATE